MFQINKNGPSFGSVDTLYEIPRYMSRGILTEEGYDYEDESKSNLLLSPSLIRLSVGCEPIEYILNDLESILR